MKNKMFIDLGKMMDDFFEAAQSFGEAMQEEFSGHGKHDRCYRFHWDENVDYYPAYSYPPANIYMTEDKALHFEFALAGFENDKVGLEFKGDYMLLNAEPGDEKNEAEAGDEKEAGAPKRKYLKRRLKMRKIDNQKYFVPADKYDQEKVSASFKNGILRVAVSPKEGYKQDEGIKVDIETEEE